MSRPSLVVILFLVIPACVGCRSLHQSSDNNDLLPLASTDDFVAIIIPGDPLHLAGAWTPAVTDLLDAEPAIRECATARDSHVAKHWRRSARQYVGASKDGKRVLYIGLFDTRYHKLEELRRGVTIVDDAGPDYLEVTYDVASRHCIERSS